MFGRGPTGYFGHQTLRLANLGKTSMSTYVRDLLIDALDYSLFAVDPVQISPCAPAHYDPLELFFPDSLHDFPMRK